MNVKQVIELFQTKATAISGMNFECREILKVLGETQINYPLIVLEPPNVVNEDINGCYEDYELFFMVLDEWKIDDTDSLWTEWVKLKGYGDTLVSSVKAYNKTQIFFVDKKVEIRYFESEGVDNTPAVSFSFWMRVKK